MDMRALALLRRNPVLRLAASKALERLATTSAVRDYEPDALVVMMGLRQEHIILIAEGRIELYRQRKERDAQLLQGQLEAPSIFGDAELYSGVGRWSVSARARVPTTGVLMPSREFDAFVASNADVAAGLYRDACARHMLAVQISQLMGLEPTERKILALMRSASTANEGAPELRARISRIDIARAVGVDRKTVTRNIRSLEARGIVRSEGAEFIVRVPGAGPELETMSWGFGASWGLRSSTRPSSWRASVRHPEEQGS